MLTVVILTKNEAVHITRAVKNVRDWAADVFVVDSYSGDDTRALAEEAGARVFVHEFENYAAQREWALRELPYRTEWVFFLDADELVSSKLKEEVIRTLSQEDLQYKGFFVKFRLYWMGKWLRHGGLYPTWILRLVMHRYARCTSRIVNEQMDVEGPTSRLENDLLHVSLQSVSDWFAKHNRYSSWEALEQLRSSRSEASEMRGRLFGTQRERKRWIREHVWDPLLHPLFRPFVYFFYAYFFRLGFLDGRSGFIYHVLQGFSYWFLIGTKYVALKESGSEATNPPGPEIGGASKRVRGKSGSSVPGTPGSRRG